MNAPSSDSRTPGSEKPVGSSLPARAGVISQAPSSAPERAQGHQPEHVARAVAVQHHAGDPAEQGAKDREGRSRKGAWTPHKQRGRPLQERTTPIANRQSVGWLLSAPGRDERG